MLLAQLPILCGVLVVLLENSDGYVAAVDTWCVESLPNSDIGEALVARLQTSNLICSRYETFSGDHLKVTLLTWFS